MKVSVCMATYNGENFIKEQLNSILKQLSSSDELIISDDGSTDRTIPIIESYRDERILLLHSEHKNLIFNFENALEHATGEIIFLSDQDDVWFDHKVEKCKDYLRKYSLVFSNAAMFYGENRTESELFFSDAKKKTGLLSNLISVKFLGATLAFKKSVLKKALPFPRNLAMHDIWLGLIAETTASTYFINEPLIYYRRHGNTASTAGGKSENSLLTKIKIRWNLLVNLCRRVWFKNSKNN